MKEFFKNIEVIAFDADDTLWVNEPYYLSVEKSYAALLKDYGDETVIRKKLLDTETKNLTYYGYGIKSFTLSMIQTALDIAGSALSAEVIREIISMGRAMHTQSVELLEGVEETLSVLSASYRLILATKGDLKDQERKLEKSGLEKYFHHIEIMSEKHVLSYQKLIHHLDLKPEVFVMVGNSLRSDILPVLELGAKAIYIPYHTTWAHEISNAIPADNPHFLELGSISHIREILS